jgi:signal peptidase I
MPAACAGSLERGDMMIFPDPRDGVLMMKRVAALEGDNVEFFKANGSLWINGERVRNSNGTYYETTLVEKVRRLNGRVPAGRALAIHDSQAQKFGMAVDSADFGFIDIASVKYVVKAE